MNQTRSLRCALAAAVMTFAMGNALAFPLYVTSINGTLSVTPSLADISNTNSASFTRVPFNLKQVMAVVSNQVLMLTGTNPPAGCQIAHDPYANITYLTNQTTHYSHDLSGIVNIFMNHMAASFHVANGTLSEHDQIFVTFNAFGHGPDGLLYGFTVRGGGSLQFNVNQAGKGTMSISGSGVDFGSYKSSYTGITRGTFTLGGTGTPEWTGPFSTWWLTNIY